MVVERAGFVDVSRNGNPAENAYRKTIIVTARNPSKSSGVPPACLYLPVTHAFCPAIRPPTARLPVHVPVGLANVRASSFAERIVSVIAERRRGYCSLGKSVRFPDSNGHSQFESGNLHR